VGWTLGAISDLFHDHGFSADYDHDPRTSGERRSLVEQFYANVDWADHDDVERMLGVFEALLDDAERTEQTDPDAAAAGWSEQFVRMLARDGVERDDAGRLRPRWVSLSSETIGGLPADSAIPMLLRRMWDSIDDNPDAAIGAAKEVVEATAKFLLIRGGESVASAETMPSLIARAQRLLDVHVTTIDPGKDGAETIRSILGALTQVALGVNELRRDYGTGHGRPTRPSGLSGRHARLAVQSADAWVRFMLDTSRVRSAVSRVAS
jgi:hypothetical protein